MIRRLLIVDRYDAPALREVINGGDPGLTWDILLLGLSNAWFRWQHGPFTNTEEQWCLVDPTPFAQIAADRVGDFVVNLVERLPQMDLGGRTLDQTLQTPEGTLWWFLEVSEKGPLRGPFVSQLYRLSLARAVIERGRYDAVSPSLADGAVADVLKSARDQSPRLVDLGPPGRRLSRLQEHCPYLRYWVNGLGCVAVLLAMKLFVALSGLGSVTPSRTRLAAFTFYPIWWARPFTAGATDRFFAQLGEAGVTVYLAWLTSLSALLRHPRRAAATMRSKGLIPLQAFVRVTDALALLSLRRFRPVRLFERHMRAQFKVPFVGVDVGPLVGDEVSRSLTSTQPVVASLLTTSVRRAASRGAPRDLLFRLEYQPFENAILRGLRGRGRGIGFLHYPFGRHYLSTRFAQGEIPRYLREADPAHDRPLPSGVIACGPLGVSRVTDTGYPAVRCAECGPQRFGRLVDYRRQRASRDATRVRLGLPTDRPVYFVTLAIVEEDTAAMLASLVSALGEASLARIIIRPHPNRPDGDAALTAALERLGPGRATLMHPCGDIYDYIVAADAMLCIGSMIAFEAMALDRMPIVFESPSVFPALSLEEFEEGLFVVRDDRQLQHALDAILRDTEEVRAKRHRWSALLRQVLGDLESAIPLQLRHALARLDAEPGV